MNASALNEVIISTEKFLEENRSKLTPAKIAMIERKLEEAKSKAELMNERAEESRKDLEKVVTTAIKQESEKVHVPFPSTVCNKGNLNILDRKLTLLMCGLFDAGSSCGTAGRK